VHIELVLVALLALIAALAVLARLLRVPYPILLVLGGVAVGFIPGAPKVELDPDLVLLIFLPPLLYAAALFVSVRELRKNVRPVSLLAIGLVLATTVAVALTAHYVIGLSWPVAFVLGAIVSPTDAVAPAEIVRRLGVPRRVVTIIEGENLTNDWTALVVYRFAVAAVVTGTFSFAEAVPKFFLTGIGGIAVGLAVGWIVKQLRARLDDPPTEITISLLTGYAAYLPAEQLGFSGVIAAVTVGLFMGWNAPVLTTPTVRMQTYAIWGVLQFLLNALLCVLVGLQLPGIIDKLSGSAAGDLAAWGALVAGVVIVVRLVWVYILTYLPRLVFRRIRERDPYPSPRVVAVIAWSGMRGAVSLAAALAL
jgi:CPA1 family monovalent cation:H+ antiporter